MSIISTVKDSRRSWRWWSLVRVLPSCKTTIRVVVRNSKPSNVASTRRRAMLIQKKRSTLSRDPTPSTSLTWTFSIMATMVFSCLLHPPKTETPKKTISSLPLKTLHMLELAPTPTTLHRRSVSKRRRPSDRGLSTTECRLQSTPPLTRRICLISETPQSPSVPSTEHKKSV